jgi:hypothetical protein
MQQRFQQTAVLLATLVVLAVCFLPTNALAKGRSGHITGKSVLAGVCSLLVWPGIGQAINDQPGHKVATHAIIGILPPFRFVSGYDALVNRQGGYWHNRI